MLPDLFDRLAAPFPPDAISWRVGSTTQDKAKGMALAYLDARDVANRLDDVCGPDGWQNRYSHVGQTTVCEIGLKVNNEWLWKADGAGATDIEAEKGQLSDSFKRSAVRWGIGRYLYGLPSPWVALEAAGRSFKIKEDEYPKLEKLLATYSTEIEWGSPESRATLRVLINTVKTCLHTRDDVRRFRADNAGTIAQMRVKARERLDEELERVEEHAQAVDA
jgi:hypothetical protein